MAAEVTGGDAGQPSFLTLCYDELEDEHSLLQALKAEHPPAVSPFCWLSPSPTLSLPSSGAVCICGWRERWWSP